VHRYIRLCLLGASGPSGARLSVEYERGSSWMSAYGTKQTSILTLNMSAFGGQADSPDRLADVR
jgi:hypothetical protein